MYYAFIYRPSDKWYSKLPIPFCFILLAMIALGIYLIIYVLDDTCKESMFGIWSLIISVVGIVTGFLVFIITLIIAINFKIKGKMPGCC